MEIAPRESVGHENPREGLTALGKLPLLPNWKPGIPPENPAFYLAGSPRGNRPRAKSSRHLEAHGKGNFPRGQPTRPTVKKKKTTRPPGASLARVARKSCASLRLRRRRRPSASGLRRLSALPLLCLRRPSAARVPVGCNATTPSENSIYNSASSSSAGSTSYSSSAHVSPHPPS